MIELKGQPAEVRFTVSVKRKETGKVETFDMVGKIITEEQKDGSNPLDNGEKHGD